MPITPPPSRGASLCNTLLLDSICVCREVHKFLLALHWCRSAVEIFLGDYHTTIMLSRVEWSVLCTHTQTSQHIKHMFTIHKGSSLPEKSVLLQRLSPASPNPTLRGFELGVFIQLLSRGIKHGPFGSPSRSSNTQ